MTLNIKIFFNHSENKRQQADYHLGCKCRLQRHQHDKWCEKYRENTTSRVVLFRRFSGYKCQDMLLHTHAHKSGE